MKCPAAWVCLFTLGVAGCSAAPPIYAPTNRGYSDVPSKDTWTARGNLTRPHSAIDGNLITLAQSDEQYRNAELTIDLKRMSLFQTVIVDHGRAPHGHCRRVAVATSVDGRFFTDRYQCPGTRRVTILSLPQPVLCRYVRLRAVKAGVRPWSIAEVFLQ